MDTSELRDKLLERRTEYRHAIAEREAAAKEASKIFSGVDEDTINTLEDNGFKVRELLKTDLESLQADDDGLRDFCDRLEITVNALKAHLEESLYV